MESTCDLSLKAALNTEEAVCFTSVGVDTLREARDLNQLPYHTLGRNILYRPIDLKNWVESLPYHVNGIVKNSTVKRRVDVTTTKRRTKY